MISSGKYLYRALLLPRIHQDGIFRDIAPENPPRLIAFGGNFRAWYFAHIPRAIIAEIRVPTRVINPLRAASFCSYPLLSPNLIEPSLKSLEGTKGLHQAITDNPNCSIAPINLHYPFVLLLSPVSFVDAALRNVCAYQRASPFINFIARVTSLTTSRPRRILSPTCPDPRSLALLFSDVHTVRYQT